MRTTLILATAALALGVATTAQAATDSQHHRTHVPATASNVETGRSVATDAAPAAAPDHHWTNTIGAHGFYGQ